MGAFGLGSDERFATVDDISSGLPNHWHIALANPLPDRRAYVIDV